MQKNKLNSEDPDIIDPEEMYLTVELEDGKEITYRILSIFETSGQDYIAVYEEKNPEEVFFYRYYEDADGNPSIDNIEDDDEFEKVCDRFDMLLDDEQFDRM